MTVSFASTPCSCGGDSALSVDEHCASSFQLGLGYEDLARAVGCDSLECGVRRFGNAVTALDPCGAKQPAHHFGLHLAGHGRNYNAFVHVRRLPSVTWP